MSNLRFWEIRFPANKPSGADEGKPSEGRAHDIRPEALSRILYLDLFGPVLLRQHLVHGSHNYK